MTDDTAIAPADAPIIPNDPPPAEEPVRKTRAKRQAKEEPADAATRLRAFEDEKVGVDAVRIGDRIERGSGSPFQKMSDEDKATYAALERLVETEQKLADAHAALIAAQQSHENALAALEPKPDAAPAGQ